MILLYLTTLLIAPQLWLEPFVDIRVDIFLYPLWFIIVGLQGRLKDFFKFQAIDYFMLAFIGWIILSTLANDQNEQSIKLIIDYIKWFVLYRLTFLTVKDVEGVQSAVLRLLVLVFIIVIEGIQHKLSPNGLGWAGQTLGWVDQSVIDAGGSGRTKWINIFDGPGVFCVMYTLALPFALQFLDKHYSFGKKILAIAYIVPLLLATWYTGSRGGFLATLGVFGGYMLFRNAERLKLSMGKLVFIAILGMGVLMAAPAHLTQVRDDNNSAQHRVDMWIQGIEMVEQNPLFGIGRGNFASYTGSLIAHNSAIENMGELGMPGLFFWVGIFYMAFRYLFVFSASSALSNPSQASLARALVLCILGYLISSVFVTLEYETYFFILGLVAVMANSLAVKVEATKKDFITIATICIGFFVGLKAFNSFYY